MRTSARLTLTIVAVVLVVGMTLSTDPPWLYDVVADLAHPVLSGTAVERLLNVVLFVPVGVAIGLWGRPWWLLGAVAGSITIELLQFLLPRSPQLSDVVTNSLGALLGYLAVAVIRRRRRPREDTDREVDWSTQ